MHRAPTLEKFGKPTSNSISTIIRYIKGSTTRKCNKIFNNNIKLWQRNYYEHVIRNEKEYWKIYEYIENNPINWKTDKYY